MSAAPNFKALQFNTSNNSGVSLSLLAEHARRSDIRVDGAELTEGDVRDYLVLTISLQKRK